MLVCETHDWFLYNIHKKIMINIVFICQLLFSYTCIRFDIYIIHRIKIVLSFLIEKDITLSGINKNIWNKSGETDVKETNCLIGGTIRYIWQNCIYIFVVTYNLWINYALSLLPLQKKEINLVFKLDL